MKIRYGKILVLVAVVFVLSGALPCLAEEKEQESIWDEEKPKFQRRQFQLTDETVDHILERLKETEPEKAEELAKLRKEDPEKFKAVIRDVMRGYRREMRRGRDGQPGQGRGHRPSSGGGGMGMDRRGGPPPHGGGGMGMDRPGGPPGAQPPRNGQRSGPGRDRMRYRMQERHEGYVEWLEENYPDEAKKLAKLRDEKPELYMRQLTLSVKKYGRIAKASEENPELAEILKQDLELRRLRSALLKKIPAAKGDEKKMLTRELKAVVGQRFELIIKQKQLEYEQLRKKLEKLKEKVQESEVELGKWKDAKDAEVDKRAEELIGKMEKFSWD